MVRRSKWFSRSILLLFTFTILVIAAAAGTSYYATTVRLQYELDSSNFSLLRQIDQKLNLVLSNLDRAVISFVQLSELQAFMEDDSGDWETKSEQFYNLSRRIDSFLSANDYAYSIDLYSYRKQLLFSGNAFRESLPPDYQWVEPFRNDNSLFKWMDTRPLTLDSGNKIYLNVITLIRSYPVTHAAGLRKGALAVNIKEESLFKLFDEAISGTNGYVFLVNANGQIISHRDKSWIGRNKSNIDYIASLLRQDGPYRISDVVIDGLPSSVFSIPSGIDGWRIVSIVPEAQLNQPLLQIRNIITVFSLILLAVAAILIFVINRWTLLPVQHMLSNVYSKLMTHRLSAGMQEKGDLADLETMVERVMADSQSLYKQMVENIPAIKWRLILDILMGHANGQEAISHLQTLGYSLDGGQYIALAAEFDQRSRIANPRDLHLYAYALSNVAEEMINTECSGVSVEVNAGLTAIIMSFAETDSDQNMIRALSLAEVIKDFVRQHFKLSVTVGVGRPCNRIEDLRQSYNEALEALKYRMIMGGNLIISIDDIEHTNNDVFYDLFSKTDSIVGSVKLLDRSKMHDQVERWFADMSLNSIPPEMVKPLVVQFVMKAVKAVSVIDVKVTDMTPLKDLNNLLSQYDNINEVAGFVTTMLDSLIDRIDAKRNNKEKNELLDRIIQFIQLNYMRSDMSLNYLADEFQLSVSHLSRLFKEYAECNFMDFLLEIRLNKARELLSGTDHKIGQIAEAAGYSNVNSFVRIFKKSTGLTPGEFRTRHLLANR